MIIDLSKFIASERPHWTDLDQMLDRLESAPGHTMALEDIRRFHALYERAASDLSKITSFSAEPETRRYLEALVARAYGELHETRERRGRVHPIRWFFKTLPQTFRRHVHAFALAVAITLAGSLFGSLAVAFDPEAKEVITPFPHLLEDPSHRVEKEENSIDDHLRDARSSFSAQLMTHNTRVAVLALALGMTWGTGTILLLFYNGVILGAVALDYVRAGETTFLLAWLLPHGAIEIPAILIAGQAGLVLAAAMIGWGSGISLPARLRAIGPDLVTLITGVALLLVWAGFVEAFLSQYHEPVFPYWAKIALGTVELVLLIVFLTRSGATPEDGEGRP